MAFHIFHLQEVYSNANGAVQYIEFVGDEDGQNFWVGHQITSTGSEPFLITNNLPDFFTDGKSVLVATQGYADLGLATPEFIIPNGFLSLSDGMVEFEGMSSGSFPGSLGWAILPTDGVLALDHFGETVTNSPFNFFGVSGAIPGNPILGTAAANALTGTSAKDFIVGLNGNDVISGGSGNDTIRGGLGADNLDGGVGTDRIQGEAGNDKMTWGAGDFFDGGANTDTLRVGVATLDLTTRANGNNKLLNIEQIDLKAGAHTLTLNRSDVLAVSPTGTVKILGDGADTVNFVGTELEAGSAPSGFTRYSIGTAVLIIDSDINVI
jgi:hypothetical protein